jgi:DUF1009 family protein
MNTTVSSLGIVAGLGLLPQIFVDEVKNTDFYIVGFKKYVSKKLIKQAKKYYLLNTWDLEEIINFFVQNDIKNILFLGYIPHKILLHKNVPISEGTRMFFIKLMKNSAMEIFYALETEFAEQGISIEPIDKYLRQSFAEHGEINNLKLTEEDFDNIKFGYNVAKRLAEVDVGLTIVVKNKIVVALEAIEGTDNCILRAKKIAGEGCYVIKVARPNQDMRFDLPVIGPTTVKVLSKAKVKAIAVEANKTLILKKQQVVEETKKLGIPVYGI